jgi:hypothetical protein
MKMFRKCSAHFQAREKQLNKNNININFIDSVTTIFGPFPVVLFDFCVYPVMYYANISKAQSITN